jgi:hypothetical protein
MFIYSAAAFIAGFIYTIFTSYSTHSTYLLQGAGSVHELIFYARRLDHSRRTRGSWSGWSHHLVVGLLRRSTGRTARFMDFVADQLVELFGAHFATDQL